MIKKTTQAIFDDGDYKGTYDWKGGMPLSEGELITIHLQSPERELEYILTKKTIDFFEQGEDQMVKVEYHFKLK